MRSDDQTIRKSILPDGLSHFEVETFPRRLKKKQIRYLCPSADLPPEIQVVSPDRDDRMCIEDIERNDTWMECLWGEDRPCIYFHADRGAVGFPTRLNYFNYDFCQVRGDYQPDVCHTRQRALIGSYHETGLSFLKTDFSISLKCLRGTF